MKNIYLLCLAVLFTACQETQEISNPTINPDNLLIGIWGNAQYENDQIVFERLSSLPTAAYAISFNEDQTYKELTSGWCGTPPLSFFTIDGTWQTEGSIITLYTQAFAYTYSWDIVSLTEEKLVVKYHFSEQEEEHRALMNLFDEIYNMANSVTCNDENNWNFTSYGAKACGGPQGYIAYSNQIDVSAFLAKVAAYTQAEHNYNVRWGIISTCDLAPQPSGVSCLNGSPVLNY